MAGISDLGTRPETTRAGQEAAEPGSTDRRRPGRAEQAHPTVPSRMWWKRGVA